MNINKPYCIHFLCMEKRMDWSLSSTLNIYRSSLSAENKNKKQNNFVLAVSVY